MTNPLIEEKEIQLARAMSDKAVARIKTAAAILALRQSICTSWPRDQTSLLRLGSDPMRLDGGSQISNPGSMHKL